MILNEQTIYMMPQNFFELSFQLKQQSNLEGFFATLPHFLNDMSPTISQSIRSPTKRPCGPRTFQNFSHHELKLKPPYKANDRRLKKSTADHSLEGNTNSLSSLGKFLSNRLSNFPSRIKAQKNLVVNTSKKILMNGQKKSP